MKILHPNTGQEFVPIVKYHLYVSVMDTGLKRFLKEIKIGPGQHTWYWVSFMPDRFIDLDGIDNSYCTFDNAINRTVNDAYCTVYEFENYEQMIKVWDEIRYVDNITTCYKEKND